MNDTIIDRGRGPEIAGTRITVYDILDYTTQGWHHTAIAAWLHISSRQVLAAIEYIEQNKEAVLAEYQKMLDREDLGNPKEIQARLNDIHAKYQPIWEERRRKFAQEKGERNGSHPGGH
jgi:uncharacterized protein (DUF433 family)